MPCFHPVEAVRSKRVCHLDSGKPVIFFGDVMKRQIRLWISNPRFFRPEALKLPCGRCRGCRLERSRSWAVRCVHEASLHEENSFITLTFDNDHLNSKLSLVKRDFQLFMKRLRKAVGQAKRVRYFHCGEYGENFGRPHHHACLFGFDFPDRKFFKKVGDFNLYTSEFLQQLWPFGFSTVGDVSFESAAYVARYVMKKVTGELAEGWYGDRLPEYVSMSLKPGIARRWIDGYRDSVYPHDFVVTRAATKCKPPRYYDKVFELTDPFLHATVLSKRKLQARLSPDNTPERLRVREVVKEAQISQLKRSLL